MSHRFSLPSTCNTSCMGNRSRNGTEPEYELRLLTPSLIVCMAFMCLLIVSVNGLVIFLIFKRKTLRTLTNMFLTSLALSDLLSGLVGLPLLLICLARDIINVCMSSTLFNRFTAISSVCHVLLIAADRYIFIVHDLKYRSFVTKRRGIVATIAVWLISIVASAIQLSWYFFHEIELSDYEDTTEDLNKQYSLACIVLFFTVPLLLMCYIYGHIFYISFKLKQRDRKRSSTFQQPKRLLRHEWRGRSVLLITMVIFAGCWLPFFVTMLDDYTNSEEHSTMPVWSQRLLVILGFIPQMLNPILCTLAKKDFRLALKEVVLGRNSMHHYNQDISLQTTRERFRTIGEDLECE